MSKTLQLRVIDRQHPERSKVEEHIAQRYEKAFHAQLSEFMPVLLAVYGEHDELLSACGFRVASEEPLFLEQYLTKPADELMSDVFQLPVSRHSLIEIGQLASFSQGSAPQHFFLLSQYLLEQGYQWCIFTATDPLHAMMHRLGLTPIQLSLASADHVPNAEKIWGSYYQHQPRVCGGQLLAGYQQLAKRFMRLQSLAQASSGDMSSGHAEPPQQAQM